MSSLYTVISSATYCSTMQTWRAGCVGAKLERASGRLGVMLLGRPAAACGRSSSSLWPDYVTRQPQSAA
jgi:hypothetical protein